MWSHIYSTSYLCILECVCNTWLCAWWRAGAVPCCRHSTIQGQVMLEDQAVCRVARLQGEAVLQLCEGSTQVALQGMCKETVRHFGKYTTNRNDKLCCNTCVLHCCWAFSDLTAVSAGQYCLSVAFKQHLIVTKMIHMSVLWSLYFRFGWGVTNGTIQ